jgi:3',5'-cyclic AMP phosphodiesterase CpdA
MAYRLLHITDQHFSKSHFWAPAADKLKAEFSPELARRIAELHFEELASALHAVEHTRPPFDAVVLSGDFTHIHRPSGFTIAKEWVRLLIERGFAPRNGILPIPGNHDVNIGNDAIYQTGGSVLPLPRELAEKEYRNFLGELGPGIIVSNEHLSVVRRIYRKEEGRGLILTGLNSCRIERIDAQGWGYVGLDQLDDIMRGLLDGSSGIKGEEGDVMIAFTHHNPLPIWDLGLAEVPKRMDERKLSFLADAPSLLEGLTTFGFALLLHGHAHLEKLAIVKGYDADPVSWDRSLVVSAQGSFCANLEDCKVHHFELLEIEDARTGNKGLNPFSFRVQRSAAGISRQWSLEAQPWRALDREGWAPQRVRKAQGLLIDKVETARRQWAIMNSWAPLYWRPLKEEARTGSVEWQRELQRLQGRVSELAQRSVSFDEIVGVVDGIFKENVDPGEISGLYLPQFLLWKLENHDAS